MNTQLEQKSMTRKTKVAGGQKKLATKRSSAITAKNSVKTTSIKRKPRARTGKSIAPAAPVQQAISIMTSPSEKTLPVVCEVPAERAEPLETATVAQQVGLPENEVHAETSMPVEDISPVQALIPHEPEGPPETVAMVESVTPVPAERISRVEEKQSHTLLASFWKLLTQAWCWTQQKLKSHQVRKRLRVCETVSLGEKRFVAVIQVDGEQFLVGGSSSSVSTLAHLERAREFSEVFQRHCEQDLSRA